MIYSKTFWTGILLMLMGLFFPSRFLIESLRELPDDPILTHQLLLGALLFKFGLITHGLLFAALSFQRARKRLGLLEESPLRNGENHAYKIALLILLIVSLALRLYKLNEGLWLDEIGMWFKYLGLSFGQLLTTYDSENQHFLYTILAFLCTEIFGETAWAMRLPAVFFGVASVWALALLGKELTSGREAFLAAALMSFSYYHIWFSQNARGYTGLLFWTILSSWIFIRVISGGPSRLWILYAVSVALGIFTQFIMVFITAGHFLIYLYYAFLRGKAELRTAGFFLGFVLAGLLTFQLYALVLPQFFTAIGMKGTVEIWNSPLWTVLEIARGLKVSFAGGFVAFAALLVFLAGFWSYSRTKPILIFLLMIPPLLGASVVIAMGHPLWPRFFFFAFGFGALVVIRGTMIIGQIGVNLLHRIGFDHVPAGTKAGLVLCICLILVSTASIPAAYQPKQDFLGAISFIEQNTQPGDVVATVGRISLPYSTYYGTNFTEVKSMEKLNEIRQNANRTWILYMIPGDVESLYPEIMQSIRKDFTIVKEFPSPLADGTIFICLEKDLTQSS